MKLEQDKRLNTKGVQEIAAILTEAAKTVYKEFAEEITQNPEYKGLENQTNLNSYGLKLFDWASSFFTVYKIIYLPIRSQAADDYTTDPWIGDSLVIYPGLHFEFENKQKEKDVRLSSDLRNKLQWTLQAQLMNNCERLLGTNTLQLRAITINTTFVDEDIAPDPDSIINPKTHRVYLEVRLILKVEDSQFDIV